MGKQNAGKACQNGQSPGHLLSFPPALAYLPLLNPQGLDLPSVLSLSSDLLYNLIQVTNFDAKLVMLTQVKGEVILFWIVPMFSYMVLKNGDVRSQRLELTLIFVMPYPNLIS